MAPIKNIRRVDIVRTYENNGVIPTNERLLKMATITLTHDRLRVHLSMGERIGGLHGDVDVPLSAVAGVRMIDDAFDAVRGLRSPGLAIPGRVRVGTWRKPGQRMFVAARRGAPALHITLTGTKLTDLVVSVPDTAAKLDELRALLAIHDPGAFTEREVTFASGQISLAGTVTDPVDQPRGVAVILPGSGEVDRDSNHRRIPLGVSRDLAHALAGKGIVSLRYDKRGMGASGGSFLSTGLSDNIDDATAALGMLRGTHPDLPAFVIGHSEGAMIAEAVAADAPDLAGVVLLAGAGVSGEDSMKWQATQIAQVLPPFARAVTGLLRIDLVEQQRKSLEKIKATTGDTARMQGVKINAKWQRELLAFDPTPLLPRITAPVLAITGGKDLQVNPDDLEIIAAGVAGPVETHRPENLTHLLRNDPKPASLAAYKKLGKQPTDARLLTQVADWVGARVAVPADQSR